MRFLRALTLALVVSGPLTLATAQGLRPEVGRPLQQAGELLKAGKASSALAKVREAEKADDITTAERLTIDRMKAAAAQRAGDQRTAAAALESIYGKVSGAEQAQAAEALAFAYSQLRDFGKSRQWADKAEELGRSTPQLRQLQQYLLSQSGDYAAIARDANAAVSAAEKAGRRPDEGDLLRLADAYQRQKNTAGYIGTLERLLAYYPKKEYWSAYLGRLTRKSGFSNRYGLDVMRLQLATDTLEGTDAYFEMAQLSLQAGLPAEGMNVIDKGFASGALGTGAQAGRHQRLRDLATKRLAARKATLARDAAEAQRAKDGNALVEIGYVYVTMGEAETGVRLIEQGIAKGGLKRPEEARLRLGMAELQVPSMKSRAAKTLRSLKGSDGVAEIGRLWAVVGRQ